MSFTIEDIIIRYSDRYKVTMAAGRQGWANSISWVHLLEDTTIIGHFWGKELAVTTGLGFPTTADLLNLVGILLEHHAAGLVVNVGNYITEIPQEVVTFCDENDFPLLTVPWEVYLSDMIKEFSLQTLVQGSTDKEISDALILAIEEPENRETYCKSLLSSFDLDGSFQVMLIMSEGLDALDSLEREKLSYRLQMYTENITHNASFFYYDSSFILVANAISQEYLLDVAYGMLGRANKRMPDREIQVGIGSQMMDISRLHISYERAKAAARIAQRNGEAIRQFDACGINRLLYTVKDTALLEEIKEQTLGKLIAYDEKHASNYVDTLRAYIRNDGSIQAVSEAMYTHRNTIIYRMNNIKKILETDLKDPEERFRYQMAFYIMDM